MPLLDRDFIDADHARRGRSGKTQLLAHVNLVEVFDGMPVKAHQQRDITDRHRATQAADLHGKA